MNVNLQGMVIQARRFNMDGNQGASIIMTQPNDGENKDVAGLDIMKVKADFGVVEQLSGVLPCECKIVAKAIQGAQQKMSFKLISIEPVQKRSAQAQ